MAEKTNGSEQQEDELKLDYTIQSPQARNELVKKIIDQTPEDKLTPKYLEMLSNYLIFAMDKEERKQKHILTDNRMVTVNKRETSFEGLVAKFENGEDGIYGLITNDKNIIFTPKISITDADIEEVPGLRELRESIEQLEEAFKVATGKQKFLLKKTIIEQRKQQYMLKGSFYQPITPMNITRGMNTVSLDEEIRLTDDGEIDIKGFSFLNPDHVSAALCSYSKIKEEVWDKFTCDAYYMIIDLENLVDEVLEYDYPMYYDLIIYKIDGKTNEEIQELILRDYGVKHSPEYLSSLWRKKIPKILAEAAQKKWLYWHYTFEVKGKWKKCSRCGQIKPAHNMFFSKNSTSKDHFYSICKDCRNAKAKKTKE